MVGRDPRRPARHRRRRGSRDGRDRPDRRHHPRDRLRRATGDRRRLRGLAGRSFHRVRTRPDRVLKVDGRGRTWTRPVRINNRRFATQAFTPAIRVDDQGNLGVIYYDFRNNDLGDAQLETDVWMLRSTDRGATWREERVTPAPFDMRAAPEANGLFTGDYIGLATAGTRFTPSGRRQGSTRPGPTCSEPRPRRRSAAS
jgi:hypothetical protein